MNQRIRRLALGLLLFLLLPISLLISGVFLPSYYSESYYAELSDMYDRLYKTDGKKLVMIGGSNISFGLDTSLLEQALAEHGFDYTVCPFGLYAAVGSSAMLELSKNSLSQGDIVILAIEPTSDTMSTYFGATAFWKCCEESPQMLLHLNNTQQAAMIGNYIPYLQERWSIYRNHTAPKVTGVYTEASFDENCNMIYERPGNTMALGYDTASPVDLAAITIAPDFAQQVNEFCSYAREVGAAVYLSFSPVNRSAIVDMDAVESFFTLCNDTFFCPVISDPYDYILESGWFYDSNFHLNTPGSKVRTMLLAEDLLTQLGSYSALSWDIPEMPASIATLEENESDADLFLYEPLEGGWLISGLTKEGLSYSTLRVPSSREGKPVVGFTSSALENAVNLEELTIPASVEYLPKQLLSGCSQLQRLILEHTTSLCAIPEDAFRNMKNLKILVPAESYSLYRDGNGCEANLWSEYLEQIFTY